MAHTTYHSKHKMDHQNIHQLCFYGAIPKICKVINNLADTDDTGGTDDGGDEEGDGNSRNSGHSKPHTPKRLSKRERIEQLLNQSGGAGHTPALRSDTGEGYLLRCERGEWKLRNVKGITVEKYKKYSATPLHFMCASRCREGLILLLQNGSKDRECTFYGTKSLTAKEMLQNVDAQELLRVFEFWSSSETVWDPAHHDCFPDAAVHLMKLFVFCNKRHPDRLCRDLLYTVLQFIPTGVLVQ